MFKASDTHGAWKRIPHDQCRQSKGMRSDIDPLLMAVHMVYASIGQDIIIVIINVLIK